MTGRVTKYKSNIYLQRILPTKHSAPTVRPSDRTEPIWLFLLSVIETCAQRLGSVLAVGGSTNFALGLEILFSAGNFALP